jgi:hypothetical protein
VLVAASAIVKMMHAELVNHTQDRAIVAQFRAVTHGGVMEAISMYEPSTTNVHKNALVIKGIVKNPKNIWTIPPRATAAVSGGPDALQVIAILESVKQRYGGQLSLVPKNPQVRAINEQHGFVDEGRQSGEMRLSDNAARTLVEQGLMRNDVTIPDDLQPALRHLLPNYEPSSAKYEPSSKKSKSG